MPIELLVLSQLFPSAATPTAAAFNRQQFEHLSRRASLRLAVPVNWIDWLKNGKQGRRSVSSLRARYFPYFYTPKILRSFYGLFMSWSLKSYRKKLLRPVPDAVLVSWAYPDAVAVERLLRGTGIPFVVKVHGSDVNIHCADPSRRKQIVKTMNRSNAVVSVSEALKNLLVGYGVTESKVHVIYNGVDKSLFYPLKLHEVRDLLEIGVEKKVFLFIGNLLRSKGITDLVSAYERFLRDNDVANTTVVFIGDGQDRKLLEEQAMRAADANPAAEIRLLGRLPHAELNRWINAADAVCLPSYSEGVPNVILEAMSTGKPVVATSVGGIPEVVTDDTGLLVRPGDIEALAEAMRRVLELDWDSGAIRAHSERFNWSENARQVSELIEKSCQLAME